MRKSLRTPIFLRHSWCQSTGKAVLPQKPSHSPKWHHSPHSSPSTAASHCLIPTVVKAKTRPSQGRLYARTPHCTAACAPLRPRSHMGHPGQHEAPSCQLRVNTTDLEQINSICFTSSLQLLVCNPQVPSAQTTVSCAAGFRGREVLMCGYMLPTLALFTDTHPGPHDKSSNSPPSLQQSLAI